ncbi:MAG: bifunctional aminoglycoside phosphotransferase/ATP-binding protein [Methylobacter sp.]
MNNSIEPSSNLALVNALAETNNCTIGQTHISWLLLGEQYVYKIKKPVNFGFLDFSSLEKRRFCCEEELRLNKRLAPGLYLDVIPVTGTPERPQLGGAGTAIEYTIKMLRFPAGQLLSEYAEQGRLNHGHIDRLADLVAEFHQAIAQTNESSSYGDSTGIKHWFDENFIHIEPLLENVEQQLQLHRIRQWGEREWHKQADLMQQRKRQGYVRECHGDLHLGNMTMLNGEPTLFDCIEFNPLLRWVDVISEVAFLFIDLLRFGYSRLAYRFLNRYLQQTGDYQGLALLRYYVVYRALVRAKVALLRMAQLPCDSDDAQQAYNQYAAFADLAERFIQPRPIALIIAHGYSGSGKSTLAEQLAVAIGAFQIRSDIERKRLFGYQALAQTGSGIDSGLYTSDAGRKTYRHLKEQAQAVLASGFPAIVDATFLKADQREPFRQLADERGVPFHIVTFSASDLELCRRIERRQHDASEATVDVLRNQQQSAEPLSIQEQDVEITIDTELDDASTQLINNFSCFLQ